MRPRFSAVTADISTKNLQRCAYRHSLQHAAKQNAIPRFPVRIARINKSGKNAEIYRAHHIKRGLKGEGDRQYHHPRHSTLRPSVISGWRGMHCARAARIDWIQHHACSIAGMAASFFVFPGSPKTGKQSRHQCKGDHHGRSAYTSSRQGRGGCQPAPDHQRDDNDERRCHPRSQQEPEHRPDSPHRNRARLHLHGFR